MKCLKEEKTQDEYILHTKLALLSVPLSSLGPWLIVLITAICEDLKKTFVLDCVKSNSPPETSGGRYSLM